MRIERSDAQPTQPPAVEPSAPTGALRAQALRKALKGLQQRQGQEQAGPPDPEGVRGRKLDIRA